ncbi:hypothetical protein [Vitreoscilla filiformis]|jgi:hypothetical protein|uniref:hypothetical protein n=1 Tax=Vitreoscilla filiformis TaxID=63 RepID=UPI000B7A918F|nr:hypothetical protein [Vitreoscilla filiformis]
MTRTQRLLALSLLSVLVGCTAVDESIVTKSADYSTVVGSHDEFKRMFILQEEQVVAIVAVNDVPVTKGTLSDPHQMKVRVDPGRQKLKLEISHFKKCANPSTTGALASVDFDVQAKLQYRVRGRANGPEFIVWLEDEKTAERKSPEARIPLVFKQIPLYPSATLGC